jgi:hypothetical protein
LLQNYAGNVLPFIGQHICCAENYRSNLVTLTENLCYLEFMPFIRQKMFCAENYRSNLVTQKKTFCAENYRSSLVTLTENLCHLEFMEEG